jgi:hypothetical protein
MECYVTKLRTSERCFSKIRTEEARLREFCGEPRPMQVCAAKFCFNEGRRSDAHLSENSVPKIGGEKICATKVRPAKVGAHEDGSREIGRHKNGLAKISVGKQSVAQEKATQVRPAEVGTNS